MKNLQPWSFVSPRRDQQRQLNNVSVNMALTYGTVVWKITNTNVAILKLLTEKHEKDACTERTNGRHILKILWNIFVFHSRNPRRVMRVASAYMVGDLCCLQHQVRWYCLVFYSTGSVYRGGSRDQRSLRLVWTTAHNLLV